MGTAELVERARAMATLPSPARRRQIRELAGASQQDIAAALNVGVMTVNRWERDMAKPRGKRAAAYAALLDQLDRAVRGS